MAQRRRGSSFTPPPGAPSMAAAPQPPVSLEDGGGLVGGGDGLGGARTTPIGLGMYGEYASSAYTARIPSGTPRFYSLARYALGASPYGRKNSYIRWIDDRGMQQHNSKAGYGSRVSDVEEAVFVPTPPPSGPIVDDVKWNQGELELVSYDRIRFRVPKDVFKEQTFGLTWNAAPVQQVLSVDFKVEFETSDVVRAYLALVGKKTSVPLPPTLTESDFDALSLCSFPYSSQTVSNLVLFVNKWTIRENGLEEEDVPAAFGPVGSLWYSSSTMGRPIPQTNRNQRRVRPLDQTLPAEYHDIVDLVMSRIIDLRSWPQSSLTRYRNWWNSPHEFRLDLCMIAGICMERKRQIERYELGLANPEDVYATV